MKPYTILNDVLDALNTAGEDCKVIYDQSGEFQIWGTGEKREECYIQGIFDMDDEEYWRLFSDYDTVLFRQVGINNVR